MSAITVDDELVHYEVLGRGKPVILIHGWLGSWRYWVPTMQQLSTKYRCYAIDLWGFGDSGKDPYRYTFKNQLDLLDHFMDKMGIPKAVIVGHGLGAALAARYAVEAKTAGRVHRLMAVSPPLLAAAPSPKPSRPKPLPANSGTAAETMLSKSQMLEQLSEEQRRVFQQASERHQLPDPVGGGSLSQPPAASKAGQLSASPSSVLGEALAEDDLAALLGQAIDPNGSDYAKLLVEVKKGDPKAIRGNLKAFDVFSTYSDLMNASVPICVLLGDEDRLLPRPEERLLAQLDTREQFKLLVMSNIQHFPMLEDKPQFARVLRDLLEAQDISTLEMKEEWRRRKR